MESVDDYADQIYDKKQRKSGNAGRTLKMQTVDQEVDLVKRLGQRPQKTAGGKRVSNDAATIQNLNQPSSNSAVNPNMPNKGKVDTEHDELNQNLLCESINEEFLKPAIKERTLSNEKFRSPVGGSKLNSPATQRSPTIS